MLGFRFSLAPLLALLVFSISGGIIWLAHIEAGEMTVDRGPPLVKAAATPIKRSPEDPGGDAVASLGGVGDLLSGQPLEAEEHLLPRAEKAVPPVAGDNRTAAQATNDPQADSSAALNALLAEVRNGTIAERLGSGGPNPNGPVTFPSPPRPVTSSSTDRASIPAPEPSAAQNVQSRSSVVVQPDDQIVAATSPVFEAAANGRYRVQLAAVRDEEDAQRAWDVFQQQIGPFISGMEPFFERAETSNGIFYRLQVGPFDGNGEADRLCNELKKQDVSCFVVSR